MVNGLRAVIKAGVSSVIEKKDFASCLKEGGVSALVESIGGAIAEKIGQSANTKINPLSSIEHKLAHFALGLGSGAATGALLGHDNVLEDALTSGAGAVIGECVAESLADREKIANEARIETYEAKGKFDEEYFYATYRAKLQPYVDIGRLVAGGVIAATGRDPTMAISAATIALENNFSSLPEEEAEDKEEKDKDSNTDSEALYHEFVKEMTQGDNNLLPSTSANMFVGQQVPKEGVQECRAGTFRRNRSNSFPTIPTQFSNAQKATGEFFSRFTEIKDRDHTQLNTHDYIGLPASYGLAALGHIGAAADRVTGGALSYIGSKKHEISEGAGTFVRRGTRTLTGNAAFAQDLGDGTKIVTRIALDFAGFKGSAIATDTSVLGKVSQASNKNIKPSLQNSKRIVQGLDLAESNVGHIHKDWGLVPIERGQRIEQALGQNLPQNCPTIDRFNFNFDNGIVTSIKSLDLRAKTYQNPSRLNSRLKGYVNKMAEYNGGGLGRDIYIESHQIKNRVLDLAIPHLGTTEQQIIIKNITEYGQSKGVIVNSIIH